MNAQNAPMSTERMIAVAARIQDERDGKIMHRQIAESMQFASKAPLWSECHQALSSKILQEVAKSLKESGLHVHYVDDREVIAQTKREAILEVFAQGNEFAARLTSEGARTLFEGPVDSVEEVLKIARMN